MHTLLSKLLQKNKVKSISELTSEEKQTYDDWEKILSRGQVTIDTIKEFCENQIKIIKSQWKDLTNSKEKNERLILLHNVYSTLLEVMTGPNHEKESLERYLRSLLDKE